MYFHGFNKGPQYMTGNMNELIVLYPALNPDPKTEPIVLSTTDNSMRFRWIREF